MLYGVYGAIALDSIATNNWSILSWARPGCLIDHLLTRCLIQTQVLTSDANVELNTTLFWNQQNGCCHLSFLEPPMALLSTQIFRSVPFWVENFSSKISLGWDTGPQSQDHCWYYDRTVTIRLVRSLINVRFSNFYSPTQRSLVHYWLLTELHLGLVSVSLRLLSENKPVCVMTLFFSIGRQILTASPLLLHGVQWTLVLFQSI